MKCVFISTPLTQGDFLHNIQQADAAFLALAQAGLFPFNPVLSVYAGHAHYTNMEVCDGWESHSRYVVRAFPSPASALPLTHADWLRIDLAWVERADCVLRLPGTSKGADMETAHARTHRKPIFLSVAEVIEWAANTSIPHGAD